MKCNCCNTEIRRPVDHPINCPGLSNDNYLVELVSKDREITKEIKIPDSIRKK